MATRIARCTNFGRCSIADSKHSVQIPQGADLICPECRQPLLALAVASQSNRFALWIALSAVLLISAGAFLLFQKRPKSMDGESGTASSSAPSTSDTSRTALRLHGSNTIGESLGPGLAAAFFRQDGASDVRVRKKSADESELTATYPGGREPLVAEIAAHGSATAFTDLGKGLCDLGMASRKIKPEEAEALAKLGEMTSAANEHVLGLDGIAVIVSRSNSVHALTIPQLAGLFSGRIASWAEVGGSGGTVRVYARDDKSGTYDSFKSMALGTEKLSGAAQRFEDSKALAEAVANDAAAIGFVGLPYVGGAKAVAVSEKGATALLPSTFTVATEDYALSRRLYIYSGSNPTAIARRFLDFALSKAGQDVVAQNGFVAQTVKAEPTRQPAGDTSVEYRKLIGDGERLSLNFRFRSGSSELDNKALDDIGRVTSFLGDLHYSGGEIRLLGFSDVTGSPAKNIALSKERASAVAKLFEERGVTPGLVTGLGPEMPVASNDTEDGRQKNRRVEIWIKKS